MTTTTPAPKDRFVRGPVGWLLGPELIGKLRKILRKRSDPRDWMPYYRGAVHDECWLRNGKIVQIAPQGPAAAVTSSAEQVVAPQQPPAGVTNDKDLWFDYFADLGDSGDAMYAVAYATMIGFAGDNSTTTWPRDSKPKPLQPVAAGEEAALRRGEFLFMGGDTAYHVADGPTLRARVEQPFTWAFEDAKNNGRIAADEEEATKKYRLYGIPGNHDWYDNLEGFSLLFRIGQPSAQRAEAQVNPIELPQLARVQLASYVAIQLPFDWQIWGLDIDTPLDERQRAYFQSLPHPERLILATPSPAIVFGASLPRDSHREALDVLGIPMPRVPVTGPTTPRYRLDLSGDVHHYARYYPNSTVTDYGSVVSGLGGAFHHPTFTEATGAIEKTPAEIHYPTVEDSRKESARELLTWRSAWFGSWARIIPFVLALVCGFASTRSIGGKWLLDNALSPWFDVTPPADGLRALGRAVCALGVFAFCVAGVIVAIRWGRRVYATAMANPRTTQNVVDLWKNRRRLSFVRALFDLRRSYWFAWLIGGVAIAPLVLYPLWAPESASRGLDIAIFVIVVALPLVAGYAGYTRIAEDLRPAERLLVTVLGVAHALLQVATALAIARFVTTGWIAVAATAAVTLGAAAALSIAKPFFASDSRSATVALALLAAIVVAGALAGLVAGARGHVVPPSTWYEEAARFLVSGVVAMPLGTIWFLWYLAVAGRLNAHNNEVGGAARITRYRELIRFHVHENGLTGYVIKIENTTSEKAPNAAGKNLSFALVDVFTIDTGETKSRALPQQPGTLELGIRV